MSTEKGEQNDDSKKDKTIGKAFKDLFKDTTKGVKDFVKLTGNVGRMLFDIAKLTLRIIKPIAKNLFKGAVYTLKKANEAINDTRERSLEITKQSTQETEQAPQNQAKIDSNKFTIVSNDDKKITEQQKSQSSNQLQPNKTKAKNIRVI